MDITANTFLIIAGQPKAGTTSLFHWLGQHPEICPSTFKETRFFLDPEYPLPRNIPSDSLEDYVASFPQRSLPVLLEASPDYLFSKRFLDAKKRLPSHKIVVITRDPVERMQSAWRYFRQRGTIGQDIDFDAFVASQDHKITPDTPLERRALDQCRDVYLNRVQEAFAPHVLVIDFAAMSADPATTCRRVFDFCGLETDCVDDFSFEIENKSKQVKNAGAAKAFFAIRRQIVRVAGPKLKSLLRPLSRATQNALHRDLSKSDEITDATRQFILDFQRGG